jgi:hypothetical protein
MTPDRVTGLCKRALNHKDLFLPTQVAEVMNGVDNMSAKLVSEADNIFFEWETFLKKHFKPMPSGFTDFYCFELFDGQIIYKRLASDDAASTRSHIFCENPQATKRAILNELLGVNGDATLAAILSSKPSLPKQKPKELSSSKVKSIRKKLPSIPLEYRTYYPAAAEIDVIDIDESDDAPAAKKLKPTKRIGRPRKPDIATPGSRSILQFMLPRSSQIPATGNQSSQVSTSPTAEVHPNQLQHIVSAEVHAAPLNQQVITAEIHPQPANHHIIAAEVHAAPLHQQVITAEVHPQPANQHIIAAEMHAAPLHQPVVTAEVHPVPSNQHGGITFMQKLQQFKKRLAVVPKPQARAAATTTLECAKPSTGTTDKELHMQCPWVQEDRGVDDTIL